jgi:hypothetical protein
MVTFEQIAADWVNQALVALAAGIVTVVTVLWWLRRKRYYSRHGRPLRVLYLLNIVACAVLGMELWLTLMHVWIGVVGGASACFAIVVIDAVLLAVGYLVYAIVTGVRALFAWILAESLRS